MKTTSPFKPSSLQAGLSIVGLILILAIIGMVGILGMKILPVYMESRAIAAAVAEVKGGSSVADIRGNFNRRALVADISSIKGEDLVVTRSTKGSGFEVAYAYEKKIPLAGNASLLLEYAGSTDPEAQAQPAQ